MRWIWITIVGLGCGGGSGGEGTSTAETEATTTNAESTAGESVTPTSETNPPDPTTTEPTTGPDPTTGDPTGEDETGETTGLPDDTDVIELRANGFVPPLQETFYSCFSVTVDFEQLHHIVGFRPVVTSPIIHHYVLSIADGEVNLDPNDSCYEWPAEILWAWAPGIDDTLLPPEAGFLVGDAAQGRHTFIVQVHYNDPLLQGVTDDDGIDVLVTPTLRENTAGIFSQGDIPTIAIPPGNPSFDYTATCPSLLTQGLLDHEIHVFSSFLHAHEIGSAITSEVYRDDALHGVIATQDPFDFNSQMFMDANIDIMPGDRIVTTCTYDSTDRTDVTMGGVASDEEMCINFMMYYPLVTGEKCGAL